ncbi:hypothetical protein HanPI659440_Chr03g0094601 [Helianthus annuus]|nr:hypothetical protein HanPI659440_Chr03g0094601 [Helianthus annuus]
MPSQQPKSLLLDASGKLSYGFYIECSTSLVKWRWLASHEVWNSKSCRS